MSGGFFDVDPAELDKVYRTTQILMHPELAEFSNEQYRIRIADELNDLFDEEITFTPELVAQLCQSSPAIQEAAGWPLSSDRWHDLDLLVTVLGYGFGVPIESDEAPTLVPTSRQPKRDLLQRALKEVERRQ